MISTCRSPPTSTEYRRCRWCNRGSNRDGCSVLVAVRRRVLSTDAVAGALGVQGVSLVQPGAQDEVLHVAEVGALVQVGVPRLGARVALTNIGRLLKAPWNSLTLHQKCVNNLILVSNVIIISEALYPLSCTYKLRVSTYFFFNTHTAVLSYMGL